MKTSNNNKANSNSNKVGVIKLRTMFWEMLKECNSELAKEYRSRKKQNDYNATIRSSWCMYVDSMKRDGAITDKVANRATL